MGDIKPIARIRAEVDDSRIKLLYSARCIKAQSLLADKLKKQSQHQRETCEHVRSANLKLQSEIVEAERNIESMCLAHQSMNMANVELKKELKLTKEKKTDFIKKIETSEKKYDVMWIESKKRFESLPHVQKLISANKNLDNTKRNIVELDELSLKLVEEIDAKTKNCADINKKRAIELAVFIVRDMPEYHKIIGEKTKAIAEISEKIQEFETKVTPNAVTDEKNEANCKTAADSEWPTFKTDDIMIMPTLDLPVRDVDALSPQMVNFKNKTTENINDEAKESFPKTRFEINMFQSNDKNDLISSYLPKLKNHELNETENYSKRKLIHILQDVKINSHDAMKIITKAKRVSLEPVEAIGTKRVNTEMIQNSPKPSLDNKVGKTTIDIDKLIKQTANSKSNKSKEPIQSEEIEEIDLTSKSENLLNPPAEFLDVTTITITTEDNFGEVVSEEEEEVNNLKESLEPQALSQQKDVASATKRVSFNLSSNIKSNEAVSGIEENATYDLNVSAASDDGYTNINDMVMKQHNLDLSPQFVYAKNTKLQKNTENSIVTSKFFQQNDNNINTDIPETEPVNNNESADKPSENASCEENQLQGSGQGVKTIELDVCDDAVTSPMRKPRDEPESLRPVSGFLFNHGEHGIADSLNLSFSTNGYEDGDNDFPHCLDSSVLLSPKANLPSPCGSNTEVSQEAPNFLSGLRKTGMSIFRFLPTSESKPDSNTAQNPGTSSGFSFNFGGKEEKKPRGGLFSMFQ